MIPIPTFFVGAAIGRPIPSMRNFPIRAANGRPYERSERISITPNSSLLIPNSLNNNLSAFCVKSINTKGNTGVETGNWKTHRKRSKKGGLQD